MSTEFTPEEPIDICGAIKLSIQQKEQESQKQIKQQREKQIRADRKYYVNEEKLKNALRNYIMTITLDKISEHRKLMIHNAEKAIRSVHIGSIPPHYNPWFTYATPWKTTMSRLDQAVDKILPEIEQEYYTRVSPYVELVWVLHHDCIKLFLEIKEEAFQQIREEIRKSIEKPTAESTTSDQITEQ